ncbi:MAG: DUF1611 domain-containing protein [Vicinamibacteria bacterium]|nr:DUF1611 domain-containing protein [Vicinamibacteria bacterium]
MSFAPLDIAHPYLLFLGDAPDALAAKTARGVAQFRPEWCLGQWRLPDCKADLGLPELDAAAAAALGARTMIVGVANAGGLLPEHWQGALIEALESGMDLASGLHAKLTDLPAVAAAAQRLGRQLHDVRHPRQDYPVGKGRLRSGKRLLTVGTDCSVGKMYTSLALEKELRARGVKADFRATGQTGILIAGCGVSVDAVVADFMSGAIEAITPDNEPDHWDLIEGQGSLFHASYAGVSLALLHGSAPDALVLCHEPKRRHMRGLPHYSLPGLKECAEANLAAARLTNRNVRLVGASLNTSNLEPAERLAALAEAEGELGVPAVDPLVTGAARIVDEL